MAPPPPLDSSLSHHPHSHTLDDKPPPPSPFPLLTPISGSSFWGAMLKLWPRPPPHFSGSIQGWSGQGGENLEDAQAP